MAPRTSLHVETPKGATSGCHNEIARNSCVLTGCLGTGSLARGISRAFGGESARFVARWDGTGWNNLGDLGAIVRAFTVHAGGLFAGRWFPNPSIAFWDGTGWAPTGSGTNSGVNDLTPYDGSLLVAGRSETAGNNSSLYIARWTLTSTGIPEVVSPAIFSVYPNPFRASTTLLYELDHPGLVHLAVFDVQGRRVATLVEGFQEAGQYSQTWNGLDRFGNRSPSGVYYLRLGSREQKLVRSVILAR